MKVALAGDVALDLMAPYFREAGFEVYVIPYAENFTSAERKLYALTDEDLYIVRKPTKRD